MEPIEIEPGETEPLVRRPPSGARFKVRVTGADLSLSHSPRQTVNAGTRVAKGDRFTIDDLEGQSVYAKNIGDDVAKVEIDEAAFNITFQPRSVLGTVQNDADNEAAPASDAYRHYWGTDRDVTANPVAQSFRAPDRADDLVVSVDDADGAYSVAVVFEDDDGNEVTRRGPSNDDGYTGDATTDVFAQTLIAAKNVRVEITDDSGASNTLDYTVYAR